MIENAPDLNPPFESDLISTEDVAAMLRNAAEEGEVLSAEDLELALKEADRLLREDENLDREALAEALVEWYEKRSEVKESL
jgi:hypothetical protein